MRAAAYVYPWDIAGDPAAAELIGGLGLDHAVLAAVYHGTRALTPRHPRHRIVVAQHTAAYYPLDPARWRGADLVPSTSGDAFGDSSGDASGHAFGAAAASLRAAGVPVHAWLVVNHVDLPAPVPQNVVNAYGDRYPWALCAAQDAVRDYAIRLAGDVATLPGIDGVEIEACGWFGFDHLGAHEKVGGVPLGQADRYLMSLCFCTACRTSYADAGIDADDLRRQVRTALDAVFSGSGTTGPVFSGSGTTGPVFSGSGTAGLAPELCAAVTMVRQGIADRLRADVVAAARKERPDLAVLLHINPQPTRSGAFTGADPATAAGIADGLVVNCWHDFEPLVPALHGGAPVYASLLAVAGLGGRPAYLATQVAHAEAAGAAGYRLYHAGLAAGTDLDAIRRLPADLPHVPRIAG